MYNRSLSDTLKALENQKSRSGAISWRAIRWTNPRQEISQMKKRAGRDAQFLCLNFRVASLSSMCAVFYLPPRCSSLIMHLQSSAGACGSCCENHAAGLKMWVEDMF